MGMVLVFQPLPASLLAKILANESLLEGIQKPIDLDPLPPDLRRAFAPGEERKRALRARLIPEVEHLPPTFDVDKLWHGLHWVLSGKVWEIGPPPENAVFGGREVGPKDVYGRARYFTAAEVAEVSCALDAVSPAELRRRYEPGRMVDEDIYPGRWQADRDGTLDGLLPAFERLREFYRDLRERGLAVVIAMR